MNKKKEKTIITKYIKEHLIPYIESVSYGIHEFGIVYKNMNHCPDNILESNLKFYENHIECRVFYSETINKWFREEEIYYSELYRILNFISAKVFPMAVDFSGGELYQPRQMYTPRIHLTEDGCYDITLLVNIPYDFFEVAQLETLDYMTACYPYIMDKLSYPIFKAALEGDTDEAIDYINTFILTHDE